MNAHEADFDRADAEAADWIARLRSGAMMEKDQQALSEWLAADPLHPERLAHYEAIWLALGDIRDDPRILQLREEATARTARIPGPLWAFAASIVLVITGVTTTAWLKSTQPDTLPAIARTQGTRLETGVGEVTRMALEDGSALTLDTDSAVETRFDAGQRNIHILKGRAFFRVAHDKTRPFIVSAREMTVTATGTEFVMALSGPVDMVRMVEGSVLATSVEGKPGPRIALKAGRSLKVAPGGQWTLGTATADADLDWINGTLSFRNARLDAIAEEMNRYSYRKIVFADQVVAGGRLNAVLKAGDMDTFLRSVQTLSLGKVVKEDGNRIVLGRP